MRQLFKRSFLAIFTLAFLAWATSVHSRTLLSIAEISSPIFNAKGLQISLISSKFSRFAFDIDEIAIKGSRWRDINLICSQFQISSSVISCVVGELHLLDSKPLPINFIYFPNKNFLQVEIRPATDETWKVSFSWDKDIWRSTLIVKNGQIAHIAGWLPDSLLLPAPNKGKLNGRAKLNGNKKEMTHVDIELLIDALAFSDDSGLHAGENVDVAINMVAFYESQDKQWRWKSEVNWSHGEVFWQPLYFIGNGHRLLLTGILDSRKFVLQNGNLDLINIGSLSFSGAIDRKDYVLADFELSASNLELSSLFEQVLKPFLVDTAFAEMKLSGKGDFVWSYHNGANESLLLDLYDATVVDLKDRFAFYRINAHVPWQKKNTTIADISFLKGEILKIPLGKVRTALEINKFDLKIPQLVIPVLDGKLKLDEFSASHQEDGWHWQFRGELLPVSMSKLTNALQIQQMHGKLSGKIPKVSYKKSTVIVEGALWFDIFDGKIVANNLRLFQPLGLAPHLAADLVMRNLDLDMVTRAFSFGKMQGRIDADILNIELSSWHPVKFDANIFSSTGRYSKKISQAAIQNISALGGAGAVAAIQRSFMRFFEEFTYSRIGWQCLLRNNICHMGGIESDSYESTLESYTIIEGGGIPAITVRGYNRDVDWQVLINRLKRVTESNTPVIH